MDGSTTPSLNEFINEPGNRLQFALMIHKGKVIFESCLGMPKGDRHLWNSASKSTPGILTAILAVEEGIGGNLSAAQRRAWFHSGQWAEDMPKFAERWRERWPGKASPSSLHASAWPNDDYAAIELVPCGHGFGLPMAGGSFRYSLPQHVAVALIALEMASEYGWPDDFEHTGRLVGHEDVGPHARVGPAGNPADGEAWDPGVIRESPWLCWSTIQEWITVGRAQGLSWLSGFVEVLYATQPD